MQIKLDACGLFKIGSHGGILRRGEQHGDRLAGKRLRVIGPGAKGRAGKQSSGKSKGKTSLERLHVHSSVDLS